LQTALFLKMKKWKIVSAVCIVLAIFSCKKEPVESEYVVERDNKSQAGSIPATVTVQVAQTASYQPTAADTIMAVFVCIKGRYFHHYSGRYFGNAFYCYDGQISLTVDSLLKQLPRKMDSTMIQISAGDSSDITIKYTKGLQTYVMHSTKGYPNIVMGILPYSCNVCQMPGAGPPYEIGYNGDPNTDKIYSRGNGSIQVGVTRFTIKAYSCSSLKECSYSIDFENYTYFKINGKWFVWINRLSDASIAGF
jgi:hypothetical protein